MDSPCIKQTVCKVLKIFQYGEYLVAYVLKAGLIELNALYSFFQHYSGLDEAVYRNIDACKELSKTTRSAFGPHGKFA